jgi:microcystin-dependent protein
MSEPFLGEIRMGGWNFAPRGWAFCNGQILSIAQNTALFSLLGTTYGGNGQTTFALPNLQGRVPMHWGSTPGLTPRSLGESSGEENHTLIITEMPAHNHARTGADEATTKNPQDAVPAFGSAAAFNPNGNLNMDPTGIAGGSQPHNNMQPYLAVTFVIAMEGIFPSRN